MEFSPQSLPPLKRTKSLQAIVAAREADPVFAAHLRSARQDLGMRAFGEQAQSLRALRLSAGLSQTQLAKKISTVQSHVARVESGKNDPGTDLIVRIALALGVKAEVVFNAVRKARHEIGTEHDGE
jgi:ribosome-binding protein aMBF1 (putative translation factor)